jgi:hypothetical protein
MIAPFFAALLGPMWGLACLRCGHLGLELSRGDAIAGKPVPTEKHDY